MLRQVLRPVDVICYAGGDGELRPLRIRIMDEKEETVVGNVCEILQTKENIWVGAESKSYLCRVRSENRTMVLELRYLIRSHKWMLAKLGQ